jgi:hypothetical protein
MTISTAESIAVCRPAKREGRGPAAASAAPVSIRATSADVVTKRGSSPKSVYETYLAGMTAAWPEDYLAQTKEAIPFATNEDLVATQNGSD